MGKGWGHIGNQIWEIREETTKHNLRPDTEGAGASEGEEHRVGHKMKAGVQNQGSSLRLQTGKIFFASGGVGTG